MSYSLAAMPIKALNNDPERTKTREVTCSAVLVIRNPVVCFICFSALLWCDLSKGNNPVNKISG